PPATTNSPSSTAQQSYSTRLLRGYTIYRTRPRAHGSIHSGLPRSAGGTQSIEDDDDFGDLVDEDDGSQAEDSGDGQRQQHGDDRQRQDDVLVDNAPPPARMIDGARNQAQIIAGEATSADSTAASEPVAPMAMPMSAADLDGNGFAGDRRDVQAAVPGAHDAVGGQALTGDKPEHVPGDEALDGDGAGRAAGREDGGTRRDQSQQGAPGGSFGGGRITVGPTKKSGLFLPERQ
ncbi:hypothetical protein ACUXNS_002899, partial [Brevibacterium pityocampae]